MATLIKFESYWDGKTYYECPACMLSYIESEVKSCPGCGANITEVADETYITNRHNEAIRALQKDPKNKKLEDEVLSWGIQRVIFEQNYYSKA